MNKQELRQSIAAEKKQYTKEAFDEWSALIRKQIENLDVFRKSQTILLYHSLPDEVQTSEMLDHWSKEKCCLLPQIQGEELLLKKYEGENNLQKGTLGILEPTGMIFTKIEEIDLVIVPGVAFDRNCNRLGRGKGYYDRLLSHCQSITIGICFDFQIVPEVPVNAYDIALNQVITPSARYHR